VLPLWPFVAPRLSSGVPDNPVTPKPASPRDPGAGEPGNDLCEVCGSNRLSWRNCKLICANCRSIVKSCADL
jgi:hypothetical protein